MSERAVEYGTVPPDPTAESTYCLSWFKLAYERSGTADFIMTIGLGGQKTTEVVSPGHRRTSWLSAGKSTLCMLAGYQNRQIYNYQLLCSEAIEAPFYQAHLTYVTANNKKAQAFIEFDKHRAELKRASELEHKSVPGRDPYEVWDEAMSALDQAIHGRAQLLGAQLLPALVERSLDRVFPDAS